MRTHPVCIRIGAIAGVVLLSLGLTGARAEIFVLRSGGRVEGELLNPEQSPRETFRVRTAGGDLEFDAAMVEQRLPQRPEEIEYEKIKPSFADTIEGQWALAQWCLEHHLVNQRKTHLERIIELEPDHAEARRALGYSQVEGGEWKTQKEVMLARGYRWYKGRYRLPQEIELMERDAKIEAAQREWFGKIKMWRGWLGSSKDGQARRNFASIEDPAAVRALASKLEDEPFEEVRKLYLEILARINTPGAIRVLAERSLEDPVSEVRLTCLDYLKKEKRPDVVAYYVGKLKSKDNVLVRRAAVGLAHMKDPSAIGPLIDALVTTHTFKRGSSGGGGTPMSFGFGTGGNSGGAPGFSFGGGPKVIKREIRNPEVRDALTMITGMHFDFNIGAWKAWYARQKKQAAIDARRD